MKPRQVTRTKKRRPLRLPTAWEQSSTFKAIGAEALRKYRASRPRLAKCGAKTKRTGAPCANVALANGRCRWHGGLTPAGNEWHKPRWPNRDAPDFEKKLARKIADRARAAKKREARRAAMTPEELARHQHWHATHKPGSAAERERARQHRKAAISLARVPAPRKPSPEEIELQATLRHLEAERARIETLLSQRAQSAETMGVFE